jgi:hypothetical protein
VTTGGGLAASGTRPLCSNPVYRKYLGRGSWRHLVFQVSEFQIPGEGVVVGWWVAGGSDLWAVGEQGPRLQGRAGAGTPIARENRHHQQPQCQIKGKLLLLR